jgi:CheY-specific phosphatase CheX
MDLSQILAKMKDSIFDVFDKMLFLPIGINRHQEGIKNWLEGQRVIIGATMTFTGSVGGAFLFLIPLKLAEELTANFLGLDAQSPTRPQVEDTVKEILNMVGGHTLSLFDATAGFKPGIPEPVLTPPQTYGRFTGERAGGHFVESDTHHLFFAVRLDSTGPGGTSGT